MHASWLNKHDTTVKWDGSEAMSLKRSQNNQYQQLTIGIS
jgi:hypothetical protein